VSRVLRAAICMTHVASHFHLSVVISFNCQCQYTTEIRENILESLRAKILVTYIVIIWQQVCMYFNFNVAVHNDDDERSFCSKCHKRSTKIQDT